MMDKFELKGKIIKIHDELEKMMGDLNKISISDTETSELRSKIVRDMIIFNSKLKDMIYHIY